MTATVHTTWGMQLQCFSTNRNFYPFRFVWDDDEHQVLSGHVMEWIAAGARWIGEGEVVGTSLYLCDNF